jgi:hypothetical protein
MDPNLIFWKVMGIIGIVVLLIEIVGAISDKQAETKQLTITPNTFEHDYIINMLIGFEADLKTDKPRHEVIDKYAVALTAFMTGWRR